LDLGGLPITVAPAPSGGAAAQHGALPDAAKHSALSHWTLVCVWRMSGLVKCSDTVGECLLSCVEAIHAAKTHREGKPPSACSILQYWVRQQYPLLSLGVTTHFPCSIPPLASDREVAKQKRLTMPVNPLTCGAFVSPSQMANIKAIMIYIRAILYVYPMTSLFNRLTLS
jgi:hypothetical protein